MACQHVMSPKKKPPGNPPLRIDRATIARAREYSAIVEAQSGVRLQPGAIISAAAKVAIDAMIELATAAQQEKQRRG